ncbi:MAG: hypothetical protein RL219_2338 [Actinomycetota bacterium]
MCAFGAVLLAASCAMGLDTAAEALSVVRWTDQFGTTGNDSVSAVGSVSNGDLYVLGSTQDGVINGVAVRGDNDLYLAKYDQYGTVRWVRQFGTEGNELAANTMAVAANGDVYVAGSTTGAFTEVANSGTAGTHDIFLMKFDKTGRRRWVRQYGTIGDDIAHGLARSTVGELYLAAGTTGVFNSGERPGNTAAGLTDALLAKFNAGGTLRWSYQFGTAGEDLAAGVSVRGSSEVYVVGSTEGDLDGAGAQVHHLGRDAFIARFNRYGRRTWFRQPGTEHDDQLLGVTHDGAIGGAVYAVGSTTGALGTVTGYDTPVGETTHDAVVMRLSATGGTTWVNQWGTTGDDIAGSVSFGWNRRIYVGASTTGVLPGVTPAGGSDQLVARLLPSGASVRARQFGTAGDDVLAPGCTPVNAGRRGRVVFGGVTANNLWGYANAGGTDATVTVTSAW